MEAKQKRTATIGIAIEALVIVFLGYVMGDALFLAIRMGRGITFPLLTTALALFVPSVCLIKGYRAYAQGDMLGKNTILGCAAATAVILGISFVPGLKTLIFGVSAIPGLQSLRLRALDLLFGMHGSGLVFLLSFVAQGVVPTLVLLFGEGKQFLEGRTPRDFLSLVLRVAGSVLVSWASYAATVGLIKADTFAHSWLIVGFIPIPGQIMLLFPVILALAGIIVIWTRPWNN